MARSWRFYGRQAEFQKLDTFLRTGQDFNVLAIRGRRQVGKTELVETFFERRKKAGDTKDFVFCELLRRDQTREDFFNRLMQAVRRTNTRLLDGFEVAPYSENYRFSDLTAYLLRQGCIVALDEFQRIRSTNGAVESEFQFLIDRLRRETRKQSGTYSRLIVLGSEQQRLVEMFMDPTAPMYSRVYDMLHVQPWNFAEFREVVVGLRLGQRSQIPIAYSPCGQPTTGYRGTGGGFGRKII